MSSKFIHSLPFPHLRNLSPASRPGPVQAERSEPEGSLDGWPRCHILRDEGMAGCLGPASTLQGPRLIAPLPFALFSSHQGLCASWGPQIRRVLQAKCRPGVRTHLGTAPVRALRAVTRTRRAFLNSTSGSCRYRFAIPTDVQRLVYLSRHPQLVQQYCQFPSDCYQRPFLRILSTALGQLQPPAP